MPPRESVLVSDRTKAGSAISSSWLNDLVIRVFSRLKVGNGLSLTLVNGQALLTATAKETKVTATSGGIEIYTAATKAALPTDVPAGSIGYVTGTGRGYRLCNSTWICDTHTEAL